MLGAFQETLETWLRTERLLPKAQRRTARRLFEGLQAEGYRGAYDSVQRFVQRWKAAKSGPAVDASLCSAVVCARRGLSVRLEPRACRTRLASCRPSRLRISG